MNPGTSILVVDDDPVVLDVISEQLAEYEFEVTTARGVDEALEAVEQQNFRLILTDIRMSPLDGYALLDAVGDHLPVVLMSSFAPPGTSDAALEAGGAGFLRKPFTSEQLWDTLSRALA